MNILDAMRTKGSAQIASIGPEAPVTEAVGRMVERRIGSLVVMAGDRLAGLITERDVLRGMHTGGCSLCDVRVGDLMEPAPFIVAPEDSLDYARDVMTRQHISHVVVMEQDVARDVISFHDLARAMLSEANFQNDLLKRYIKNWPE